MSATKPAALARVLYAGFPEGIDAAVLWEHCEAAGLPMSEVGSVLDNFVYEADQRAQRRVATIDPRRLRVLDLTHLDSVRMRITGSSYAVSDRTVLDLTHLDSVRMRITGSSYAVSDRNRARYGDTEYLLVREPDNARDPATVAVYGKGRRVGYVAASRAGTLAPLLDQLDADAFAVSGAGTGEQGSRLWVDLPRAGALRALLRGGR